MAFLFNPEDDTPTEITREHRDASLEAIHQVCHEVSVDEPGGRHLYVDVGHFEDPGFLNPQLFSFWILPVTGEEYEDAELDRPFGVERFGVDWAASELSEWTSQAGIDAVLAPRFRALVTPSASSKSDATTLACVLNHPIEVQIEAVITALAMLVARQDLMNSSEHVEAHRLPVLTSQVDEATQGLVSEEIRSQGWRAAAAAIRERARSTGLSLHVAYRQPLLSSAQLRERMPLARHVYNVLPGVSDAVDRIVNILTQGLHVRGALPERMVRAARDAFEAGGVVALTAHLARDAFVCGVGVLSLEGVPVKNPWLVRPEDVEEILHESALVRVEGRQQLLAPALPLIGAAQIGSTLGLSILEPLIQVTANYELYLRVLLLHSALRQIPEAHNGATNVELDIEAAKFELSRLRERTVQQFNPAILRLAAPASGLYLPGRDTMEPSATRIALRPLQ